LRGAGRRPIIRTCGPILELPSTYQSYSELAEGFSSLINERELGLSILFDSFGLSSCTLYHHVESKEEICAKGITIYFSQVQVCI